MTYHIRFPRPGVPALLIAGRFVATGECDPGDKGLVGILSIGTRPVAVGRDVREPQTPAQRFWSMVFDLTGVDDVDTTEFKLEIFKRQANGNLEWKVSAEPIILKHAPAPAPAPAPASASASAGYGVVFSFPSANTDHCRLGFTTYGSLTDPDTRVTAAALYQGGTSTAVDAADAFTTGHDRFWYAVFDEVPVGNNYDLKVSGNVTTGTVQNLDFTDEDCA